MSVHSAGQSRVTVTSLRAAKADGRRIVMLTAYDFNSARLVEAAGVDAILIGDSLGMTVLGYDSTLPVTVGDIISATSAVSRACERVLVVADMPFMSYQASVKDGMRNAGRLIAEGGAHAVKLEGATASTLKLTCRLTEAGIPVMGHVGLTPQSVNAFGGYKTQAKDSAAAAKLLADCVALQDAGAFAIVLECIPAELAARVSELLEIPTIGIGAGADCDGEVQVFHDILGLGDFTPRHTRRYAELGAAITDAVAAYAADVRLGAFPAEPQCSHVDAQVIVEAEALYGGSARRDLEEPE